MKSFLLTILIFLLLVGCKRADSTVSTEKNLPKILDVVLVSHLGGALGDDPDLMPGQTVRVLPHETEPPSGRREPVVVTLPSITPFAELDQQYFLRGFAIGKLSLHNNTFL